jgi:hypothetical protein
MQGWSIVGSDELLGMSVINEPASLLHNKVLAPRLSKTSSITFSSVKSSKSKNNCSSNCRNLFGDETAVCGSSSSYPSSSFFICWNVTLGVWCIRCIINKKWVSFRFDLLEDMAQWVFDGIKIMVVDRWRYFKSRAVQHSFFQANTWRHPLKPINLIDKSIYLSNLLHFYYAAAGSLPLELDWSVPATKKLVDDNATVVHFMQALQIHTRNLRKFAFSSLIWLDLWNSHWWGI